MKFAARFWSTVATVSFSLVFISCAEMSDTGGGSNLSPLAGKCVPGILLRGQSPVGVGACVAGTATLVNKDCLAVPVTKAVDLELTAPAGLELSSHSDCSSASSPVSVRVPSGASTTSFWYKGIEASSTTSYRVTATAPNYKEGALAVQVTESTGNGPTDLRVSGSDPFVAGCGMYTLTVLDDLGVASSFSTAQTLAVSTTRGSFKSNADCSGDDVSSYPLAAGASTLQVYVNLPIAQFTTLTFGVAGITAQLNVDVAAGNASKVTLNGPIAIEENQCAAYDAAIADASGNPVASAVARDIIVTGMPTYSDECSTANSTVTIAANTATKRFWARSPIAGNYTLAGTSGTLTLATLQVVVSPAAASPRIVAEALSAPSALVNSCLPVRLRLQNGAGNAMNAAANLTVGVATAIAGGGASAAVVKLLSPAGACAGSAVSSAVITAGSSFIDVGVQDTVAESIVLNATAPAYLTGTLSLTFTAGPVAAIRVMKEGFPIAAGLGCGRLTLNPIDSFGNDASFGPGTPSIALSSKSATAVGGSFQSSLDCSGAAIQSIVAPAEAAGVTPPVTVSYKNPVAGTYNFVAATIVSAAPLQGTETLLVTAAPPAALAFDSPRPSTAEVNECAGPFRVSLKDSAGNATTNAGASAITVSLGAPSSVTFYSNADCSSSIVSTSIASNAGSSPQFYVRGTAEEDAAQLTASSSGLTTGTANIEINAEPLTLVLDGGTSSFNAGVCQTYSVRFKNAAGAFVVPNGPQVVTLALTSSAPSNLLPQFYISNGCSTNTGAVSSINLSPTQPNTTLTLKARYAGALTATLSSPGVTSATRSFTVNAGAPDHLGFAVTSTAATQNVCSPSITVKAYDVFNNVIRPASALSISLTSSDSQGTFRTAGSCAASANPISIAAGNDQASFSYRTAFVGTATLTAAATGYTSATTQVVVVAGSALSLAGATTATTGDCVPWSVTATPSTTSPRSVTLSSNFLVAVVHSNSGCTSPTSSVTIPTGATTASFYLKANATVTSTATITASLTGFTNAMRNITISPASTNATLSFTGPSTAASNACLLYTVGANTSSTTARTVNVTGQFNLATFYPSAGCATSAQTTVTIAGGATTQNVYVKFGTASVLTNVTLTASATGYSNGMVAVAVSPPAPQLTLTITGSNTGIATQCLKYTVSTSAPLSAAQNITMVSTGTAAAGLSSSASCDTGFGTMTVNIPAGSSSGDFYVKFATLTQTSTVLQANATGMTGASKSVTINPGSLAITGTSAATSGQCLSYKVTATPTIATARTVTIASNNAAMMLSASEGCTGLSQSLTRTVAANATDVFFWAKFTTAASVQVNLQASSAGLPSVQLNVQVSPDLVAHRFYVYNALPTSQIVSQDACATGFLGIGLEKNTGVAVSDDRVVNLAVVNTSLNNDPGSMNFYGAGNCLTGQPTITQITTTQNLGRAAIYVRFRGAGTHQISISAPAKGSLPAIPSQVVATVVVTNTIAADTLYNYDNSFTATSADVSNSICYSFPVGQKRNGSPVRARRLLTLSAALNGAENPAPIRFYTGAGCTGQIVNNTSVQVFTTLENNGQALVYFKFIMAGTVRVRVSMPAMDYFPAVTAPLLSAPVAVVP